MFPIERGVKQGIVINPLLFNAALELAMKRWKNRMTTEGFRIEFCCQLTNIRYADDLMIYAKSSAELASMLESLIEELAVIGLHLNAAKTKIFTTDEDAPDMIEVADSFISVLSDLDSHKYLGRKLPGNLNNRSSVEIAHRIQIAWMKFHQHTDVLIDKNVCIRSRLRFFDAIISPTILFGLGTCALTQQQINQLDRVQRRMLRTCYRRMGSS